MYFDVRCVPVACSVRDMNVDGMLSHRVIGAVVTLSILQVLVTIVLVRIVSVIAFSRCHVDAFQVVDGRFFFFSTSPSACHCRNAGKGCFIAKRTKRFLDVRALVMDRRACVKRAAHEPPKSSSL